MRLASLSVGPCFCEDRPFPTIGPHGPYNAMLRFRCNEHRTESRAISAKATALVNRMRAFAAGKCLPAPKEIA